MHLRALLFDVDGTLADTEELHRSAFNDAFRLLSLGWVWGRELYAELLAVSGGAERIAAYIDRLQAPAAEKTRLRRLVPLVHGEKTRIYRELLASGGAPLRPGVARLIDEARAAGLRIGLAATSASAGAHARGIAIDAIVCADQVARKKPAPDLYELALATLRVPAAACAAFEDSANGLAAAKAAGLFTVVTPSRWTLGQDFSAADLLLPTLEGFGLAQLEALRAGAALRGVGA
jgi:HAD superfamily hydrolase (TIGR01509 family)